MRPRPSHLIWVMTPTEHFGTLNPKKQQNRRSEVLCTKNRAHQKTSLENAPFGFICTGICTGQDGEYGIWGRRKSAMFDEIEMLGSLGEGGTVCAQRSHRVVTNEGRHGAARLSNQRRDGRHRARHSRPHSCTTTIARTSATASSLIPHPAMHAMQAAHTMAHAATMASALNLMRHSHHVAVGVQPHAASSPVVHEVLDPEVWVHEHVPADQLRRRRCRLPPWSRASPGGSAAPRPPPHAGASPASPAKRAAPGSRRG